MANLKNKIEELDSDTFNIRAINVNRGFVSITYDADLDNKEIQELIVNKLEDNELFAIDFKTDTGPETNEMVEVVEFRVK